MVNKLKNGKNFRGMNYRLVQKSNSENRQELSQQDQNWLKVNGYRNVGWDNVIALYQKIEEFNGSTLESLFLEADRIGNKYQTSEERQEYQQKLATVVNNIAEQIDQQFPDNEVEIIDFSNNNSVKYSRNRNRKSDRTTKV